MHYTLCLCGHRKASKTLTKYISTKVLLVLKILTRPSANEAGHGTRRQSRKIVPKMDLIISIFKPYIVSDHTSSPSGLVSTRQTLTTKCLHESKETQHSLCSKTCNAKRNNEKGIKKKRFPQRAPISARALSKEMALVKLTSPTRAASSATFPLTTCQRMSPKDLLRSAKATSNPEKPSVILRIGIIQRQM